MAAGENEIPSRQDRLAEFIRRLATAPPAETADAAYHLLCDVLNRVEDELTGLPFEPENWAASGRIYPPQMDRMSKVGTTGIMRFDHLRHVTYIAPNGAILIRRRWKLTDEPLNKAGSDGKTVIDLCADLSSENL